MLKHFLFCIALLGGCWSGLRAQQLDSVYVATAVDAAIAIEIPEFTSPRGKYLMITDVKSTITTVEFTTNQIIERSITENGDGELKTYTHVAKNPTLALNTPFVVQLTEYVKFKQTPDGTVTKQKIKRKEVKAMARMNGWMILNYDQNSYNCSVSDKSGITKSFILKSVK